MKRNEMSEWNKEHRDNEFSIDEWPLAELAAIDVIDMDVIDRRQRLRRQLSLMTDNDIIDHILDVLPAKVKLIYEDKMAKRRLEEMNAEFPDFNGPPRSKDDKIVDILNRLDREQLQDLEAKLLEYECLHRRNL